MKINKSNNKDKKLIKVGIFIIHLLKTLKISIFITEKLV